MKRLVVCSQDCSIGEVLGSRIGAEIVMVEDWPKTFEIAKRRRPDGLVVDLRSGLRASSILSDLESDDRVAGVPVLLIDPSPPSLGEELRGFRAHLTAPFTADALVERVGNLLQIPFRRACRVLVRIEILNEEGRFFGLSEDVSLSGIFVESDQQLGPEQRRVDLRFCVPPKASRIAVVGHVVRVRPGRTQRFGYGIMFEPLADEDLALLRAFVER